MIQERKEESERDEKLRSVLKEKIESNEVHIEEKDYIMDDDEEEEK